MNTTTDVGPKRLTRPREGRMVAGVCEGIARYAGVDPVIVRLAFVMATLFGLAGVVVYIAAWLLVPEES